MLYDYGTQIALTCFTGLDSSPGSLCYAFTLHSNSYGSRATVVFRSDSSKPWNESQIEVSGPAMNKVHAALDAVLGNEPTSQVAGNLDTSLGWVQCILHVRKGERVWTLDLPLRLSGFSGPGSPELAGLIRELFAVAGVEHWLQTRLDHLGADT